MATAFFVLKSSLLLKTYYSYEVTSKVTLKYEKSPEFPAVTICHFNMLRESFVKEHKAEKVLEQALWFSLRTNINRSVVNWKEFGNLSMKDVYEKGGHQIKEMMKTCSWSGEECDARNFTRILTPMGLCHTFNSGKEGRDILRVRNAGSKFGLNLVLDVQQDEYVSLVADQAGFMVLIHDQETPPMVEELGFAVGPGTTTFAALSKQKVINLEAPYETNCSMSTISNIPGFSKYTTSSCMLTCHSKYIVEKCGCRDITLPALTDNEVQVCDLNDTATCVFREMENFFKFEGDDCDCQVPCETISYKPSLSYGAFPSKSFAYDKARQDFPNTEEGLDGIADALHENYSENRLELNVYFQQMSYELIKQQPAYDDQSLLGEIGGLLGLCIGASLLTVVEFCDVIFTILKIRFGPADAFLDRKVKRRKAMKKKTMSAK
ncbi:acid-sensing ion channel 1-like [Orbicella faveolata]|uniref:acid-sensing ion channel 1-like n=1 Tax=Orbicella faveolata TaxID=48498 RepID=UPI0009E5BD3B|nr:acid-sensing ion channel 1-like [Orbicella faveolata]